MAEGAGMQESVSKKGGLRKRARKLARSGKISEKAMMKLENKRIPTDAESAEKLVKAKPIA